MSTVSAIIAGGGGYLDQVQVIASLEFKVCVLLSTHPALLCNCSLRFGSLLASSPSGLPFLLLCRLFLVLLGRLLAFLSRPLFLLSQFFASLLCRLSQGGSLHSHLW